MTNSILEITEKEYLIKLNRQSFNLSFIRSLLKMVEVSKSCVESDDEVFILNKRASSAQIHSSEPDYYSSLDEK